jgi:hypothetical protein
MANRMTALFGDVRREATARHLGLDAHAKDGGLNNLDKKLARARELIDRPGDDVDPATIESAASAWTVPVCLPPRSASTSTPTCATDHPELREETTSCPAPRRAGRCPAASPGTRPGP